MFNVLENYMKGVEFYDKTCKVTRVYSGKVYIAGPMQGIEDFNFPAFDKAHEFLLSKGFDVVNPASEDRKKGFDGKSESGNLDDFPEFDRASVLAYDTKLIAGCTHIYMLTGWEYSTGAYAEWAFAKAINVTILYEDTV